MTSFLASSNSNTRPSGEAFNQERRNSATAFRAFMVVATVCGIAGKWFPRTACVVVGISFLMVSLLNVIEAVAVEKSQSERAGMQNEAKP